MHSIHSMYWTNSKKKNEHITNYINEILILLKYTSIKRIPKDREKIKKKMLLKTVEVSFECSAKAKETFSDFCIALINLLRGTRAQH